MKTFYHKKMFLLLALSSICTYGQGILKGTVTDSLSLEQLKGAEIILTGTNFNAVSNTDGEFYITGIPTGEYILQISYLGYQGKKYLVSVNSEETLSLNIELLPNITNGNDMVLTDQAKSQAEEINLENKSSIIKNVISGKKLQNMPEENIPIALSRLPGVTISYKPTTILLYDFGFQSRGSNITVPFPPLDDFPSADDPFPNVMIRGLDSKYSNITIDGIRIPPTSIKDKSINLSILSERNFKNIELQKTITPDEDADATAGAINIVTGKAPYKRMINAKLTGNYNGFDKSANQYNFTGNYGERFFNNLLGVQVDASVEKKILSSEYQNRRLLVYGPNFSFTNAGTQKYKTNILLDFNTPDGGSIRFNNFYNKIKSDYFETRKDSFRIYSSGPVLIFHDRETDQKVVLSSIGGNNHLFGFDIDWSASFSETKNDHPINYSLSFYNPRVAAPYILDTSIDSPSKNYNKERNVSFNINRNYILSNEITGGLKLGIKYLTNSRSFYEDSYAENGNSKIRKSADGSFVPKDFSGTRFNGLEGEPGVNILLSYFQDSPTQRIVFDKDTISLISKDALRLWRELNYSEYYVDDGADINSYDLSGSIFAGYAMHQLNFGRWIKLITGLRIENEHNKYAGYYFTNNSVGNIGKLYNLIPQKTNEYNYDKVTILPNFQVFSKLSDFLNLRLAVYKTLIRPDINARIPKFIGIKTGQHNYVSMGNPELKNANVWNHEVQAQFYGNDIGQLGINLFYKDIEGMQQETDGISINSNIIDSLGINLNSLLIDFPFSKWDRFNFYSYYNSPKPTRIWGFEIEHQANFRYLPGLFKNIILNYNLTFLRSESWGLDYFKVNAGGTQGILSKQKLYSLPEFFVNVILGYDIKGFSFRISYFYQDNYSFSRLVDLPFMENKLSRLDIAFKQQLLENISLVLNLNNITNSKEEYLMHYLGTWTTFQAYRAGMNIDFGIGINL